MNGKALPMNLSQAQKENREVRSRSDPPECKPPANRIDDRIFSLTNTCRLQTYSTISTRKTATTQHLAYIGPRPRPDHPHPHDLKGDLDTHEHPTRSPQPQTLIRLSLSRQMGAERDQQDSTRSGRASLAG